MDTERKGRRSGEQKREQLRRAAYRCFRDFGYHETTVDSICEAAGSSKGSFYWHYASKQEVFIDILESWSREVMDELYEQFQTVSGHEDYMRVFTEGLSREVHRGRAIVPLWIEFTTLARREREIREALSKFYRRARTAIAEILRPPLEGLVTEEELRGIAGTLFGGYAGLMVQDMSDPDHADARQVIELFMGVLGRWFRKVRDDMPAPPLAPADSAPPERLRSAERPPASRATAQEIESLLGPVGEDQRRLFDALRALVLAAIPEADERVIGGWKVLAYGRERLICYVKARRADAHVGLYHGADLPDPDGLLCGGGKRMRHVVVTPGEPLPERAIAALVRSAWERG